MNKIGAFAYWSACAYVFSHLFLMNSWVQFFDGLSLLCTFFPAIFSVFIIKGSTISARLSVLLKVMWISACLTMLYGVILTLSNLTVEYAALAAGIGVSCLPIFYALCVSLLLAPLVMRSY